jgi:hypothetical protein
MPTQRETDVVRAVTAEIDIALRVNRRHEVVVVILLVSLFAVGLSLIVYGALTHQWLVFASGGLVKIAILYPLRILIRLREANVALRILPQLLQLAGTQQLKALAAKLIVRLIQQV